VDFVGLSLLSGAHNELFPRVVDLLAEKGAEDIVVFGGGIIPDEDIQSLKQKGVAAIFGPGTTTKQIVAFLESDRESS
jgi:methylmalonyl-CoA mutase C-terminal domain/subunit